MPVTTTVATAVARAYGFTGFRPLVLTDPYFNQTVLLLHGDGTNGAQNNTFLDSSTNNFTITRNGNTTQGTFSPFSLPDGQWSNYFDGSGDSLSAPANTAFDFGTGDFTIEAWVYITGNSPPDNVNRRYASIFNVNSTGTPNLGFSITGNSTTTGTGLEIFNGSTGVSVAGTINQNTWNHVAVSKAGSSVYFWLNGAQLGSTQTTSGNWGSSSGAALIGRTAASGFTFDLLGYISNLRIVKGTAVYTSNFTPPTTPLTAITNTSLLTCQSNRFVDKSTNNFAITRNGDVSVRPFGPFNPPSEYNGAVNGGSGYFDGSGDYLSVPDDNSLDFSGDFIVEWWMYRVGTIAGGTFPCLLQKGAYQSSTGSWQFVAISSNDLFFQYGNPNTNIAAGKTIAGEWCHIAITRSGNSLRTFNNGVLQTTATVTNDLTNAAILSIGADNTGTSGFNAYVSNLRIVKGTALYTSNFTPPTAPLTAITNTSLLLNFTNAGIIDSTGKNVLETVGNAQIDTAVSKFGSGSMEFDGTGDYAVLPYNPDLLFASGNFTIEGWVYRVSAANADAICGIWTVSTSTASYLLTFGNGDVTRLRFGSSNGSTTTFVESSTGAVPANQWVHFAIVRNGNTLLMFADGVQVYSASFTTTLNNTTTGFTIASVSGGGNDPNIFIDDLRITKGVARYTANFTPPARAFEDR